MSPLYLSGSMLSGSGGGSSSGGGGGLRFDQQDKFYVHALRRDADGMLRYTKQKTNEGGVVDVSHRTDGSQLPGFLEGIDYVDETTENKEYLNHSADKYQQYRFDFRKLSYYIDAEGYLVAQFGDYDYSVGPK